MLKRLVELFGGDPSDDAQSLPDASLHRAAAALLAFTARLDGTFDTQERQTIRQVLQDRFALSPSESQSLLETADKAAAEATDLFGFTETINRLLPPERRPDVIEMLWEVAYADGSLHDYEANLVRRAAGLLHVTDRDSGIARRRVLQRLGIETT